MATREDFLKLEREGVMEWGHVDRNFLKVTDGCSVKIKLRDGNEYLIVGCQPDQGTVTYVNYYNRRIVIPLSKVVIISTDKNTSSPQRRPRFRGKSPYATF